MAGKWQSQGSDPGLLCLRPAIIAPHTLHTQTHTHTRNTQEKHTSLTHRLTHALMPHPPTQAPSTRQHSSSHRCAHTHTRVRTGTDSLSRTPTDTESCSLCQERKLSLEKLVAGSDLDPTLPSSLPAEFSCPPLPCSSRVPSRLGCHLFLSLSQL